MKGSAQAVISALSFLAATWLVLTGTGYAQQTKDVTTVVTIGSSRIVGDDRSVSRDQAVEDALVTATYQVLIGLLPQEVLSTGFQGINNSIFARTDQFINGYKVLTESVQGKSYRLLIQADVSTQRIKEVLKNAGIWVDQQQMPRILICVAEKSADEIEVRSWWGEQAPTSPNITTSVLSHDLAVQSYIIIQPDRARLSKAYPWDLGASDAVALGRIFDADVVVAGTAVAEPSSNTMGGHHAVLSRQCLGVGLSGLRRRQQIAHSRRNVLSAAQESADGERASLSQAAAQAGAELSDMIRNAWRSQGAGNFQLEVLVEGTGGKMASFVKFRGALSTMSGVDNVQLKEMSTNDALLLVAYQGSARSLADALLLQSFDTFGIDITEVGLNSIRVQLTGR